MDDIWSFGILDLKLYGEESDRGYRYVLVIIDIFSKFGWRVPLKNKNAQLIKVSFQKFLIRLMRKPNLIETDWGKEFYQKIFQNFSKKINIKHCSRNTYLGTVFAESFNRTIRDLLKRPVFEKGDLNWIGILPRKTKQYNNKIN